MPRTGVGQATAGLRQSVALLQVKVSPVQEDTRTDTARGINNCNKHWWLGPAGQSLESQHPGPKVNISGMMQLELM